MYEKTHLYLVIYYYNSIISKSISSIYDKTTMLSHNGFYYGFLDQALWANKDTHVYVIYCIHIWHIMHVWYQMTIELKWHLFNSNNICAFTANLQILWAPFKFYKPKMRCKKIRTAITIWPLTYMHSYRCKKNIQNAITIRPLTYAFLLLHKLSQLIWESYLSIGSNKKKAQNSKQ